MVAKGRLDGKMIVLDGPLDLPAGSRVVLQVEPEAVRPLPTSQSLLEWIEANAVEAPVLPADLSRQHDHYLYGTSKKSQA